jgi:hypothetical protein
MIRIVFLLLSGAISTVALAQTQQAKDTTTLDMALSVFNPVGIKVIKCPNAVKKEADEALKYYSKYESVCGHYDGPFIKFKHEMDEIITESGVFDPFEKSWKTSKICNCSYRDYSYKLNSDIVHILFRYKDREFADGDVTFVSSGY